MRKNDLKQDCKMTWDQINQKYPEDRSEMDEKRERKSNLKPDYFIHFILGI